MKYNWDKKKNQLNFEKHGLSFEDVELIFERTTRLCNTYHFNEES